MNTEVSLDLMEFVEKNIIPRYAEFDAAHSTSHVMSVIRRSIDIARRAGADLDMAYTIAAYHDLGLSGPRAIHHVTGARILATDQRLRRWFTPEQLRIMSQAVEDHRASASHAPRTLYGRIVAEADRDMNPNVVFSRTVMFGLANYPELSREEQWQRFRSHVISKYSADGYIRLWIEGSENHAHLARLRQIIASDEALLSQFNKHYDALVNEIKKS